MKPCSLKSVPSFHTGMCVEAEGEKMGVLVEEERVREGPEVEGRNDEAGRQGAKECVLKCHEHIDRSLIQYA